LDKQKIGDATSGSTGILSPFNFPDYPAIQSWLTENKDLIDKYNPTAYDPAKAKEIIESKGYVMGSDGFYAKDGQPLAVDILVKSADVILPSILVQDLQDVGIQATPRPLADAAYFNARNTGDFDIETSHVNCGSVVEPYDELNTLNSRWIKPVRATRAAYLFADPIAERLHATYRHRPAYGHPMNSGPGMIAGERTKSIRRVSSVLWSFAEALH